jgi:hypothetical protein
VQLHHLGLLAEGAHALDFIRVDRVAMAEPQHLEVAGRALLGRALGCRRTAWRDRDKGELALALLDRQRPCADRIVGEQTELADPGRQERITLRRRGQFESW